MPAIPMAARLRRLARRFPAAAVPFDPEDPLRVFKIALVVSLVLHALVLSVRFRLPETLINKMRDSQLEVVLVNSKTSAKPAAPQARAQANLDGGGNVAEERRAKTPLPALREKPAGEEIIESRPRAREQERRRPPVLVQERSPTPAPAQPEQRAEAPEEHSLPSGVDLARSALAMARMEAEISRNIDAYSKWPKRRFVGAQTVEAAEAQYVEDWRQKVERVGNLNYPDSARGKLYGSLVLSVAIRADGSVESVEVDRSSGHKLLDEAAVRIVRLAAPFGPLPGELRRKADVLVIPRTWTFTRADQLQGS